MSAANALAHLSQDRPERVGRDRLEILTALISAPSFDPIFRPDVVEIPRDHPVYRWACVVDRCERNRHRSSELCSEHLQQWSQHRARGVGKAAFLTAAKPLGRHVRVEELACRVCPRRPSAHTGLRLCRAHLRRWCEREKAAGRAAEFDQWLGEQTAGVGYGSCRVAVCVNMAESPLGLCSWHGASYRREGRPGTAALPTNWWQRYEQFDRPVPVSYVDEELFVRWCASSPARPWAGQINLRGLRPLVRAEIKWGLFIHAQRARPTRWDLGWIRSLVATCGGVDRPRTGACAHRAARVGHVHRRGRRSAGRCPVRSRPGGCCR